MAKGALLFLKERKYQGLMKKNKLVCSPGPAKYSPTASQNPTVFSFGKQKKESSFVKMVNKDIPSPGKYKIKRDFISKKFIKGNN